MTGTVRKRADSRHVSRGQGGQTSQQFDLRVTKLEVIVDPGIKYGLLIPPLHLQRIVRSQQTAFRGKGGVPGRLVSDVAVPYPRR